MSAISKVKNNAYILGAIVATGLVVTSSALIAYKRKYKQKQQLLKAKNYEKQVLTDKINEKLHSQISNDAKLMEDKQVKIEYNKHLMSNLKEKIADLHKNLSANKTMNDIYQTEIDNSAKSLASANLKLAELRENGQAYLEQMREDMQKESIERLKKTKTKLEADYSKQLNDALIAEKNMLQQELESITRNHQRI